MAKPTTHHQYLELYNRKLSDSEIAQQLDKSVDCVRSWRRYRKLHAHNVTKPTSVPMEQALTPEECVVVRAFLSSLVSAASTCPPNTKLNIGRFMYQWQKAYLRGEVP